MKKTNKRDRSGNRAIDQQPAAGGSSQASNQDRAEGQQNQNGARGAERGVDNRANRVERPEGFGN